MATDEAALKMKKRMAARRAVTRRRAQRDALWPEADTLIFQITGGGWAQMPRTIPMIAALLDELGGKSKPGKLYLALWAHEYGDGLVEVRDPVLLAAEAGYVTNRAERTFLERMRQLRELQFIKTAPIGAREFGFVLLLDPHQAVWRLRKAGQIPELWWTAFSARCAAVGIELPEAPPDEDEDEDETTDGAKTAAPDDIPF